MNTYKYIRYIEFLLLVVYKWSIKFEEHYNRRMKKALATHSSTLAWEIPWREEPVRLQSMGSQRVRHD